MLPTMTEKSLPGFDLAAFDLLLFDLDGTLVDSAPDIAAAVDVTLSASGCPSAGVERVRSWVGNGSRKLIERALVFAVKNFDAQSLVGSQMHETVHSEFLLEYAKHNGPETRVFDGVYEFLQHCEKSGKKMACVTNKPEHLARQLVQHLDMEKYFAMVIGGDTFPQRKPDPTALLYCCQQQDVPAARTLMIGDSETDVASARAANMKVLCVSYGYNHGGPVAATKPDWLVDDLRELMRN
jgi:phosphoglycolate phosphatase